jgi:uncharacterized protein (DUF2252 family)
MSVATRPPRRRGPRATTHLTTAERTAAGKAARKELPRSRQGVLELPARRPDPVALLERQAESRVPELVPIRHARMLASPFAFFRGAAAVMAADLARLPRTGFEVQLCGDGHLANFGIFAAPDRRLVFDCNDFDETSRGPFEWDVKRLAASVAVAGRDIGLPSAERRDAVRRSAAGYRHAIRDLAAMRNLDVWYARLDIEPAAEALRGHIDKQRYRRLQRNLDKARAKDSLRAFDKLTEVRDGARRIVSEPPLITPIEELADAAVADRQLHAVLAAYRESLSPERRRLAESYRYVHAAHKVVGVGSVGTRAWIVLLEGRDSEDPLFLQAKEAQASVLEPYTGASRYRNHGRRVVEGQRLMQAASDIFLGWVAAEGIDGEQRHFYVRQLWDGKGSAEIERMSAEDLGVYAELCGRVLARAHARSGDRFAIADYLGRGDAFDKAIVRFAERCAELNEGDFEALSEAADRGEIPVAAGDPKA